jgi:type VI secretion system secreted protein VgrG
MPSTSIFIRPARKATLKDKGHEHQPILRRFFLETRALASDAVSEVFRGGGNARSLCAGYTFTLSKNPRTAWNRKYLLTTVTHHADQVRPIERHRAGQDSGYTNRFTAVSSDIVFKPAQTFVKPRIYGPQTAMVVGPGGEEIYR